ncbi:cache domain-containing protein [Candidatus Palauibacter sp.]|uniref:cache domain-containing protein n=1 Tax=Candidatus Palauibacter sp. TaxID=3101350 RepID=UPI003AF26FA4
MNGRTDTIGCGVRRGAVAAGILAATMGFLAACRDGGRDPATGPEPERPEPGEIVSTPPIPARVEYTKAFVGNAIGRYESQGLDATLAHYNGEESMEGEWYLFIINEDDLVIGHPHPHRRGQDLLGWVGTDANGYDFGPEMLSADEDGTWVSYVYTNPGKGRIDSPDPGDVELKSAWVMRHDGLLFGSGWYIDADEFTQYLVATAVRIFRSAGLQATVEAFNGPESVTAGLATTIEYYNNAPHIDGVWVAFIAHESGNIVDSYHPAMLGRDLYDILGTDVLSLTEGGNWIASESARVWVVSRDGFVFGAGWLRD